MALADRYTGRDLVLEFTPSGGSLGVIQADYKSFSIDRKMETTDVTAANEVARNFLTTLSSLDFSLSIFGGDEVLATNAKEGVSGRLDIYPKGKSTGKPKLAFNVIIGSFQVTYPFDNAVEVEISGQRTGAMIWDFGSVV